MKRKPAELEKYSQNIYLIMNLYLEYKELSKLNNKKINNPIKQFLIILSANENRE